MTMTHRPPPAPSPGPAAADGAPRPDRRRRGILEPGHPHVVASTILAVGGTAFVHLNRGALADPWPVVAVLAWVLALGAWVWTVLLRRRVLRDLGRPRRGAGVVYVVSVAAMLGAFALGRWLLASSGHLEVMPALVVVAVGLHFVPFTWAFRTRMYADLGWALAAVGAVGVVLGVLVGPTAVAAAAVVGGLVMLVAVVVGSRGLEEVSA